MDSLAQRLRAHSAHLAGERVAMQQLADAHGTSAQGAMLVLLAVPCLLPIPGAGSVLALGIGALSLSIWRRQPLCALPLRVGRLELPTRSAQRVLSVLAWFYAQTARLARTRLAGLTGGDQRLWLAPLVAAMALLILLPIPWGNVLPAIALVMLGLGLVFEDGVAVLLGAATATLALATTALLAGAAVQWVTQWLAA